MIKKEEPHLFWWASR